jgi:hypothetical protein
LDNPTVATSFKAATDYVAAVARGETALNKVSKSVFNVSSVKAAQEIGPNVKDNEKLAKMVEKIQVNPDIMLNKDNHIQHYMPEHAMVLNETVGRVVGYLNTLRPDTDKRAPLDSKIVPSAAQKAKYDQALTIANDPLSVIAKIPTGRISSSEILAFATMYPGLYLRTKQKLTDEMVTAVHKGKLIPYKTRLGLSLFMAEPLDSTMKPESIQATQPTAQQPQQASNQSPKGSKSSPALQKMSSMYQTPGQSREAHKSKE